MCGIVGIANAAGAAEYTYVGLHAIQHRAIEYAGMVTTDGSDAFTHHGTGVVRQVFNQPILDNLHGRFALGHIRYATVEDKNSHQRNIQPLIATVGDSFVAIAHNGNLTNADSLRQELLNDGALFATSLDTEVILHRFMRASGTPTERLIKALDGVRGSYTLVLLMPDMMIATVDPSGNRPLMLGQKDGGYFIASESAAFQAMGVTRMREIEQREIIAITKDTIKTSFLPDWTAGVRRRCRFEHVYYALPSSIMFGQDVANFRLRLGRALELTSPTLDADYVFGVPDSATFIAYGYGASGRSGIYVPGILRNHYVGRTFIQGRQGLRDTGVSRKFSVVPEFVRGKKIALIDDSIVRLTTMPRLVERLRALDAKEIHVRIGSPQVISPCHYGIDTPTHSELAAAMMSLDAMKTRINCDSLEFLSLKTLRSLSSKPDDYCYACWTGQYPACMEPQENAAPT